MIAVTAVLLTVRLLPEKQGHPVAWRDLSSEVGPLRIVHSQRRLFRERAKLADFLRKTGGHRPPPRVDFANRQLLLVSPGPRSSTGYEIVVLGVREEGGKLTVKIRERAPGLRDQVRPRVTYPYRLLSLPADEQVYVDWLGR